MALALGGRVGAPPDLTQNALERVVGANPPPVSLRESVVGEGFLDRRFHQLGGAAQAQAALACMIAMLASVNFADAALGTTASECVVV